MLKGNYHTHTHRCGHASGSDLEYVLEALASHYLELGFSDHIMLPGFSEPGIRGEFSLFYDYCNSLDDLRKKYQDQIKIFIGFEAESFPAYFPFYKEILDNKTIDYLILGNHAYMNEEKKIVNHFAKVKSAVDIYLYRDLAISALKTGLFSCFAHPDYFMSSIQNIDRDVKRVMEDIVECAVDMDVPLEINIAGIRNGKKYIGNDYRYIYPTDLFLKTCHKMKAKVILGQDAHAPHQLSDEEANGKAIELVRKYDLHLIERLPIRTN